MSTTMYKFTDANNRTYGGFQWTEGEWQETSGEGKLCGPGWLHCFSSPELAGVLIHAMVVYPPERLWEAECAGQRLDDGTLKSGFSKMRLVKEIPRVTITMAQQVRFAQLCADAARETVSNDYAEFAVRTANAAQQATNKESVWLYIEASARYAVRARPAIDFPALATRAIEEELA